MYVSGGSTCMLVMALYVRQVTESGAPPYQWGWRMRDRSAEMSPLLPATPLDIPNMFTFWEDRRPAHPAEPLQRISLVHSSQDVPLHSDYRPGQIESRLELLQAQLSRWAGLERN